MSSAPASQLQFNASLVLAESSRCEWPTGADTADFGAAAQPIFGAVWTYFPTEQRGGRVSAHHLISRPSCIYLKQAVANIAMDAHFGLWDSSGLYLPQASFTSKLFSDITGRYDAVIGHQIHQQQQQQQSSPLDTLHYYQKFSIFHLENSNRNLSGGRVTLRLCHMVARDIAAWPSITSQSAALGAPKSGSARLLHAYALALPCKVPGRN
ncbi:hypothetical protein CEP54_001773 [Fusarium duplospermum]|uniref:Uncharacterized protein n=1 Tax=Fusarium duplospermum TaxID=1325734 RepID=A0A428QZ01_9HYPO|nr:hypothetical protein CEP54_001773 [Fusarium duplospermum]